MAENPFKNIYDPIKIFQVKNGWVVEIPKNENAIATAMNEMMKGAFQGMHQEIEEHIDPILANAKQQAIEEIKKPIIKEEWHIFTSLTEALSFIGYYFNDKAE